VQAIHLRITARKHPPSQGRTEQDARPFTLREIQRVLAVADPEWQSLIKFGLYTGQRLGDLGHQNGGANSLRSPLTPGNGGRYRSRGSAN
jgi:integrase